MSLLSHYSVPITISGCELSTRFSSSCFLFLVNWQFTTIILTGVSKRFLIDLTGVFSNGDEAADGLPISIKEDELVLNVSNLFNVAMLVVSNRQLEKFGSPQVSHSQDTLCRPWYTSVFIPMQLLWYHVLQVSHHTAGMFHVTAFPQMTQWFLGVRGPGFGSGA